MPTTTTWHTDRPSLRESNWSSARGLCSHRFYVRIAVEGTIDSSHDDRLSWRSQRRFSDFTRHVLWLNYCAAESYLSEQQKLALEFRTVRNTTQNILVVTLYIVEKYRKVGRAVHYCFIHFRKAFNSVWHECVWAIMWNKQETANIL